MARSGDRALMTCARAAGHSCRTSIGGWRREDWARLVDEEANEHEGGVVARDVDRRAQRETEGLPLVRLELLKRRHAGGRRLNHHQNVRTNDRHEHVPRRVEDRQREATAIRGESPLVEEVEEQVQEGVRQKGDSHLDERASAAAGPTTDHAEGLGLVGFSVKGKDV